MKGCTGSKLLVQCENVPIHEHNHHTRFIKNKHAVYVCVRVRVRVRVCVHAFA